MRILLAECDKLSAMTTACLLGEQGYEVLVCESMEEALCRLAGERFGAVVVDRQTPGCECPDFVKDLPKDRLPVILVGSYWSRSEKKDAVKMGVAGVLTKPFPLEALTDLLPRPLYHGNHPGE